jgi:hypothetical protein
MTNGKFDLGEISKELEDKIKTGLQNKQLNLTDISLLISEHISKVKEKVLKDAGELISTELQPDDQAQCKDCGGLLKKTKS